MTKGTAVYHTHKGDIEKIHLVADAGKVLTNDGESFWNCIDVDSADGWYEIDEPIESEETAEEETYGYSREQLEGMSNTELKSICTEMSIPTSMVKQNMIDLILSKQGK